jgi:hypothetical protein
MPHKTVKTFRFTYWPKKGEDSSKLTLVTTTKFDTVRTVVHASPSPFGAVCRGHSGTEPREDKKKCEESFNHDRRSNLFSKKNKYEANFSNFRKKPLWHCFTHMLSLGTIPS